MSNLSYTSNWKSILTDETCKNCQKKYRKEWVQKNVNCEACTKIAELEQKIKELESKLKEKETCVVENQPPQYTPPVLRNSGVRKL